MCQPAFLLKRPCAAQTGSIFSLISLLLLSREGPHEHQQDRADHIAEPTSHCTAHRQIPPSSASLPGGWGHLQHSSDGKARAAASRDASHGPAHGTRGRARMLGCGAHTEHASSRKSFGATQRPRSRLPHFLAGSCIFSLRGF